MPTSTESKHISIAAQELRPLCQVVEPLACLLGAQGVHLRVNDGFRAEYGREYIDSRDVNLELRHHRRVIADLKPVDRVRPLVAEFTPLYGKRARDEYVI